MNKFIKIICCLGGTLMFALAFFAITLMLCPGISIFGVRYIGFAQEQISFTQEIPHVKSNNLILNTCELETNIIFRDNIDNAIITIDQSFIGFTTKKLNSDYVVIKNNGENCEIIFEDCEKFLFGTNRTGSSISVVLPSSFKNLNIITKTANVSLSGATISAQNVSFSGKGVVNVSNAIQADVVNVSNVELNMSGRLGDNSVINVNSDRNVSITKGCNADINVNTSTASVYVSSCKNLNVSTSTGKITMKNGTVVAKNANIKTISGDIDLANINGRLIAESSQGNIRVGYVNDAFITNGKGETLVTSVGVLDAFSKSGKITVVNITDNAKIKTFSGKVVLSDKNANINYSKIQNVVVETDEGNIEANNLYGNAVSLSSVLGKIVAYRVHSEKMMVSSSKGFVSAELIDVKRGQIISNGTINVSLIGEFDDFFIRGDYGNVNVSLDENIKCSLKVETQQNSNININGYEITDVSFSDDAGIANLKITTNSGKVNIINKN